MIRSALSSTALIGSDTQTVLELAGASGCKGVEWTDDGFIEPGDSAAAVTLMYATLRAGLCTASYSSLFRVGLHGRPAFDRALVTARELNAPIIRLWAAPRQNSPEADEEALISTAQTLGDAAGLHGITLCLGLSPDSLLDTVQHASAIFSRIDHPFVKLAWAPAPGAIFDQAMESLAALSDKIGMVLARTEDIIGPAPGNAPGYAAGAGDDGELSEAWLQYLDAFEEQGGNPDMSRYVVIRSLAPGDNGRLADSVGALNGWSVALRQLRRRRVL